MEADWGLICSDATNLKIKNLTLITKKSPVMDFKNCKGVEIDGFKTGSDIVPVIHLSGSRSENISIRNAGITDQEKQLVVGKEVKADALRMGK